MVVSFCGLTAWLLGRSCPSLSSCCSSLSWTVCRECVCVEGEQGKGMFHSFPHHHFKHASTYCSAKNQPENLTTDSTRHKLARREEEEEREMCLVATSSIHSG